MAIYGDYMDRVSSASKKKDDMQISLFGTFLEEDEGLELEYPTMTEFSSKEKLNLEKSVLGIYLSGHPLSDYREQFSKMTVKALKNMINPSIVEKHKAQIKITVESCKKKW